MSYTSNQLSHMLRNICLAAAILAFGASLLWVNSLKHTIALRDDTIGTLKSVNAQLVDSNETLKSSLQDERDAVKREQLRSAKLEAELKTKLGKFDHAVKDDKCANTAAPDAVIDSLQ